MQNKAQERFDEKYITSTEIREEMDVPRSALFHAIRRGHLPQPIRLRGLQVHIWERKQIAAHLAAWKKAVYARRGDAA